MKRGKHSKAVKRLGPRYGKRTRERLAKVESMSKNQKILMIIKM